MGKFLSYCKCLRLRRPTWRCSRSASSSPSYNLIKKQLSVTCLKYPSKDIFLYTFLYTLFSFITLYSIWVIIDLWRWTGGIFCMQDCVALEALCVKGRQISGLTQPSFRYFVSQWKWVTKTVHCIVKSCWETFATKWSILFLKQLKYRCENFYIYNWLIHIGYRVKYADKNYRIMIWSKMISVSFVQTLIV